MLTFNDFLNQYNSSCLVGNAGAKLAFDFLARPESIVNFIIFSELRLPVLTGKAYELETLLQNNTDFPLISDSNRKYVGKMIKFIMSFYGYTPISATSQERKLRKFSKASLFKTSSIYSKTIPANLKISVTSESVN